MIEDLPRPIGARQVLPDRIFRGVARSAGVLVLAITSFVGLFLSIRAYSALRVAKLKFLTTAAWQPDSHHFGIAAVLSGSVMIGLTAIVTAVPLAVATALYISEYAPRQVKGVLVSVVDLMAAVPSIIYGIWGFFFLQPDLIDRGAQGEGLPRWLSTYFGWIPIFKVDGAHVKGDPHGALINGTRFSSSTFIAGLVVALMVTPIACSIMREAFTRAPLGEREGAYALGATRWGMIRTVVLPFGRGGIIGGTMLGLGRALGETIAVFMIISQIFVVQPHILQSGSSSVAALIALRFGEASKFGVSALMAAGLALFVLTLLVNFAASAVIARSRSGATSEA